MLSTFGPYVLTAPAGSSGATVTRGYVAALGTTGRPLATAVRPATGAAVALYPNLARQAVTVGLPAATPAHGAEVVLFNALGQDVQRTFLPAGVRQAELGLAQLPTGVYTVRVSAGAQVLTTRLVII